MIPDESSRIKIGSQISRPHRIVSSRPTEAEPKTRARFHRHDDRRFGTDARSVVRSPRAILFIVIFVYPRRHLIAARPGCPSADKMIRRLSAKSRDPRQRGGREDKKGAVPFN